MLVERVRVGSTEHPRRRGEFGGHDDYCFRRDQTGSSSARNLCCLRAALSS
jgi:hypothetical protein